MSIRLIEIFLHRLSSKIVPDGLKSRKHPQKVALRHSRPAPRTLAPEIFSIFSFSEPRHNGPKSSYETSPGWTFLGSEKPGILFWRELGRPGLEAWLLASSHKIGNNFTVIRQRIFNQNKKHLVAGYLFSFT